MAELIGIETRYRGWCEILIAKIRLPDGREIAREIEDHGRAVCVLPYDPERRTALLVRQTRAPMLHAAHEARSLEAIAGLIDEGEEPDASVRREALEEAGLILTALEHVTRAWTMPGLSTERMDVFLARYSPPDRQGSGGGIAGESIEVVELPLHDLAAMADAGTLADLKTLFALQTLRLRRPELFTPA